MFHFVGGFAPDLRPSVSNVAMPGDLPIDEPQVRALHASALAHAARRRRAAAAAGRSADSLYWKAGVPSALAKAASLRREPRFKPLP